MSNVNDHEAKVLIVPCSGIGKAHGLMAREAVYQAVDELGEKARTLCLGLLVAGDEDSVNAARTSLCIVVDGRPKLCSLKNVDLAGGRIAREVRVVDVMKEFKGAQPGSATALTEEGWAITAAIARRLVGDARQIIAEGREG